MLFRRRGSWSESNQRTPRGPRVSRASLWERCVNPLATCLPYKHIPYIKPEPHTFAPQLATGDHGIYVHQWPGRPWPHSRRGQTL